MSKIIKPIKIFVLTLFAILLLVIILITFLTFKSLPDYNRIVLNSLVKQDVKIFRNKYAIPNIVGKTNEDINQNKYVKSLPDRPKSMNNTKQLEYKMPW